AIFERVRGDFLESLHTSSWARSSPGLTREGGEVTRSLGRPGEFLLPPIPEGSPELVPELDRKLVRLSGLVERDGLPDVVHHDLAGIATGKVRLEPLADGGVDASVDVVVQRLQELIALHGRASILRGRPEEPRGRTGRPGRASAAPGAGAGPGAAAP